MRKPAFPLQGLRLSLRQLMIIFIGGSSVIWLGSALFFYLYDYCEGRAYTHLLCELYRNGVVDGNLCQRLCQSQTFYIHSCFKSHNQYRIFFFNDTIVKVRNSRFVFDKLDLEATFRHPEQGSSMQDFRHMVHQFLLQKLDGDDHSELAAALMDYADCNHDGKVSLAEAKSLWALLQHNDFFMTFLFHHDEYTPKVYGSCGDLYALEQVQTTPLFNPDNQHGLFSYFFPESYTWAFPDWEQRSKIAIGLLEFALEAYQHASQTSFHMCNLHPTKIGYSTNYDVRITDLSEVISERELSHYFEQTTCHSHADCQYSHTCQAMCNHETGFCQQELVHPNLYYICQILRPYLSPGLPRDIKGDMGNLWDKCDALSVNNTELELQHSLVLIDLKSVLWKQIS